MIARRAAQLVAGALALAAIVVSGAETASAEANYFDTVLGTGTAAFSGDGGPGKRAALNAPAGMTRLPDGSILIADASNHRIRRLATDGTVSTVAGTGTASTTGDGGAATAATVNTPWDVEVQPGGGGAYYISENGGHVVRRVSSTGTITTVVGTGAACTPAGSACGNYGAAGSAQLNAPRGLSVASNGDLYACPPVVRAYAG